MEVMTKFQCRVVFVILSLLWGSCIYALELDPKELRSNQEVPQISVVQNRFFHKSFRPELSINVGLILNEAYLNSITYGANLGFFFNEYLGIRTNYFKTSVSDSNDKKALNSMRYRHRTEDKMVSVNPDVVKINSGWDIEGEFSPFYGKLNILDKLIVYSDIYLSLGMGRISIDKSFEDENGNGDYVSESFSKLSFNLGLGQRFYIKQSMAVRIEVKDRIFDNGKKVQNSIFASMGFSYFFL